VDPERTGAPDRPLDPLDPDPLLLTWRPVDPRLIWVVLAGTAVVGAAAAVTAGVAWAVVGGPLPPALLAATVTLFGARVVLARRAVRSWGYAERDDDLLVRHGLLVRRLSIVPYARMQFVDVTAGPLERMLGLATVTLHTAAAASDARVPGLPFGEAARLRDRLTTLGRPAAEGL
jgi:membrane protein YdbS with pleckstrin-like domain